MTKQSWDQSRRTAPHNTRGRPLLLLMMRGKGYLNGRGKRDCCYFLGTAVAYSGLFWDLFKDVYIVKQISMYFEILI